MARKKTEWTYCLRLLRNPEGIRMDRLAAYLAEFAEVLGKENEPVFKGIRRRSTGALAWVPPNKQVPARKRLLEGKVNPEVRAGRALRRIDDMLGEDGIKGAELLDANCRVIYTFHARPADDELIRVKQAGTVDGTVTGLVGADDTMHLHLRDIFGTDLKFIVRSEDVARELLTHFRRGTVRLEVDGGWVRTDDGWLPEANRCTVRGFEPLDDVPLPELIRSMQEIEGNGWRLEEDPMATWRDLRGIH